MKTLFSALIFALCLFFGSEVSAQANRSVNQFFVMNGDYQVLQLDLLSENVKIMRTPGTRIRLEMSITLGNPNDKMLDFLIEKGRYELTESGDNEGHAFQITHKRPSTKIIIKGEECNEDFKYVLYVPESVKTIFLNGKVSDSLGLAAK